MPGAQLVRRQHGRASKTARVFTALTTAAPPGGTWQERDTRISNGQGNYGSGVFVDSQNPDILYTMSTAMYRSTDGGVTFEPFKGAPGGEDYHKLWIDPTNGKRMLVGSDAAPRQHGRLVC
jgi:hypothetical protein